MLTAALAEALVSIILLALGFVVGKHRDGVDCTDAT
jgi:hypothetical protein